MQAPPVKFDLWWHINDYRTNKYITGTVLILIKLNEKKIFSELSCPDEIVSSIWSTFRRLETDQNLMTSWGARFEFKFNILNIFDIEKSQISFH